MPYKRKGPLPRIAGPQPTHGLRGLRKALRRVRFNQLDMRTPVGAHLGRTVRDLTQHLGGNPNVVQEKLIRSAAIKAVLLDAATVYLLKREADGQARGVAGAGIVRTRNGMIEPEPVVTTLLQLADSLERTLVRIGIPSAAERPKTVAEVYAGYTWRTVPEPEDAPGA